MKKIEVVINDCFGGFSLSDEAILRYAELKNIKLYPHKEIGLFTSYYKIPKAEYDKKEKESWAKYGDYRLVDGEDKYFSDRDIPRDDKTLIKVIRELGVKANGMCADLKILEIPENVKWHIAEYDGNEHIAEDHRTWS